MQTLCVIPARMGSSRYPGKPLKTLLGLELVLHVYARCKLCPALDRVVIATCDDDIRIAAESYGAEVVMTADSHPGCVDRTDEAVRKIGAHLAKDDFVLMVQGDEIMVSPEALTHMARVYSKNKPPVVNLASPIVNDHDHADPNVVKVVGGVDDRALYFSRAPIPATSRATSRADHSGDLPRYQQTGVIGFAKYFIQKFGDLAQTPLEKIEHIDMLRVIENGLSVQLVFSEKQTIGVDTKADHARAEILLKDDVTTPRYLDVK